MFFPVIINFVTILFKKLKFPGKKYVDIHVKIDRSTLMYQDEIFSNAITDAKKEGYDSLTREIKGMEAAIERFFSKIFETTASVSERDFNVSSF